MSMLRVVLVALLAVPAWAGAEALRCPDVSAVVQVGTCPSEAELTYTFGGYCGDNKRMYEIGDTVCESYENYRKAKNVVLWASADGQFEGYVSCDLPEPALRAAVLEHMTVSSKRGLTRVACGYSEGVLFAHRTRASCEINDAARCAADASACEADCQ
ncbi:MAG: hypothetical protein KDF24_06370 [Rhodocyclaceae bacterium]|nr:hypothetical protein [Rhodocyclaceae bacterium]MCB1962776.1 hypothetical protein [Rhodocyclaceae bacterium]